RDGPKRTAQFWAKSGLRSAIAMRLDRDVGPTSSVRQGGAGTTRGPRGFLLAENFPSRECVFVIREARSAPVSTGFSTPPALLLRPARPASTKTHLGRR